MVRRAELRDRTLALGMAGEGIEEHAPAFCSGNGVADTVLKKTPQAAARLRNSILKEQLIVLISCLSV